MTKQLNFCLSFLSWGGTVWAAIIRVGHASKGGRRSVPSKPPAPCMTWEPPAHRTPPDRVLPVLQAAMHSAFQLPPAKTCAELLGRRCGVQHSHAFNKCWLLQKPERKIPLPALFIPHSTDLTIPPCRLSWCFIIFLQSLFFPVSHLCFLHSSLFVL